MRAIVTCLVVVLCFGATLSRLYTTSEGMESRKVGKLTEKNKVIINDLTPAEAHKATSVPEYPNQDVYSGFVQITKSGSSMYFISYSALDKNPDAPFILWLQGGPGCSSWQGNLIELGPYKLTENDGVYKQTPREYTWNEHYHLLFIDNPLGAGYSYVTDYRDYVTSEEEMSRNLYKSLEIFFEKFPEYAKNDFYIFGESYAGHYIPSISKYILERMEEGKSSLNLKAVGIGDGWTDPIIQVRGYSTFGYANGFVDKAQEDYVKSVEEASVKAIKIYAMLEAQEYMIRAMRTVQANGGGLNQYNYRVFGNYPDIKVDFLNESQTKKVLHIPEEVEFVSCDATAYNALTEDFMSSMKFKFPYILDRIPVLLYNGQNDIICNVPGSEDWIRSIDWTHAKEYREAGHTTWKNQDGEVAGYERVVDRLVQVIVIDAGHMVPMDQIKNSQNMVERFIKYAASYKPSSDEGKTQSDSAVHSDEENPLLRYLTEFQEECFTVVHLLDCGCSRGRIAYSPGPSRHC